MVGGVSVDSTDSPPSIHISAVMRDAGRSWRLCNEGVNNAWDMRESLLNKRPIPGHFSRLPIQISIDGVQENVKIALHIRPAKYNIMFSACWSKVLLLANIIEERLNFVMAQKWFSLEHRKCIS